MDDAGTMYGDQSRRNGGRSKANVHRAAMQLPHDIRDGEGVLFRSIGVVERGKLASGPGPAFASLARAYVTTDQAGELEARRST